ncbi:related to Phosphatidylinositol transfer protein SFH5 [Ramularia collo-cygni]|uniref:Phosphatidylinositol transfer protein SFH5 n=1 Tax=Ramularia collo-cygni TaxID=112498 RepID=A0A2D3V0W7_9PEZI|nr:related to Phosphatidylinositol transfer protein SFH5 [Ramularia collo-cygni]CZT16114.1 related to Phosphatidylinositol transfer protein SFH5 [Ramularia collo-cygni]
MSTAPPSDDQSNVAEATATKIDAEKSDWSNLPKTHPLHHFGIALGGTEGILAGTDYNEMYGVELVPGTEDKPAPHTTLLILQKFLRANTGDLDQAKSQLSAALKWRKEYQPLKAVDEAFDGEKFRGLGYISKVKAATETKNEEDVVAYNIYGAAAKDSKKVFGDTDAFVRWRVAQMELTLAQLNLNNAEQTIPDYGKGPDPYTAINVHDYMSVSFFRQPAEIKASSSKLIDLFQRYYPETVSYKYFVNVPIVMQWMMGAMKALMSKDSIQRMTWMTYGNQLHTYLGSDVPKEYGGTGLPLEGNAITPRYAPVGAAVEATSTNQTDATHATPPEVTTASTAKRAGEPPITAE